MSLIQSVYRSLSTVGHVEPAPGWRKTPAVPIKKSVFPDYIVCLEDGKKLKMLKRHLQTSYGLTPEAYRTKWGLPADYPDGRAQLRRHAFDIGKADRPGTQAGPGTRQTAAAPRPGRQGVASALRTNRAGLISVGPALL